jgi:hypothetical protein
LCLDDGVLETWPAARTAQGLETLRRLRYDSPLWT